MTKDDTFIDLLFDLEEETIKEQKYNAYLKSHRANVKKAFEWLKHNIPDLLDEHNYFEETSYYGDIEEIIKKHDRSKDTRIPDDENYYELTCEYNAYADYFYGDKTPEVEDKFDRAWLAHIHANPHHWQHWILHNDTEGTKPLDMPYVFIIEMICDHWSFSWKNNDLHEIFKWYETNKYNMILSQKTRSTYEHILEEIKAKL